MTLYYRPSNARFYRIDTVGRVWVRRDAVWMRTWEAANVVIATGEVVSE